MKQQNKRVKAIRNVTITALLLLLSSFSIAYASYNANLYSKGEVAVSAIPETLHVSQIKNPYLNGAEENYPYEYKNNEVEFQTKLNTLDATAEYDIVFFNNTDNLYYLKELKTVKNTNENIKYEVTGISIGDVVKPRNYQTAHIKISYKDLTVLPENLNQYLHIEFIFEKVAYKNLIITYQSDITEIDFRTEETGAELQVQVTNPNPFKVSYYFNVSNEGFSIVDSETSKIGYEIPPNSTYTNKLLFTENSESTFENIIVNTDLMLNTTNPVTENQKVTTLTVRLKEYLKNIILMSYPITEAPNTYTEIEKEKGYLMRTREDDNYTYYYRGVISNNYVSFAGYLWRIVRIDNKGNIRLVLDSDIGTSKFSSKYVPGQVENIEEATRLVDYRNSDVKMHVDNWYKTTIAPKEESKYVVKSNFCVPLDYRPPIETSQDHTVSYYKPYWNVGKDFPELNPEFSCNSADIIQEYAGLLSAVEVYAAGGLYGGTPNTYNNKYYLYMQKGNYWLLSASYYSLREKQIGVFWVKDNGGLHDWISGSNVHLNAFVRPVISLSGSVLATGDGTITNPFRIS